MTWEWEEKAGEYGFTQVCGVDEAGRGSLAGPVCAAAVVLPPHWELVGLDDSKKLTAQQRECLYEQIERQAVAWAAVMVDHKRIDEENILRATMEAMQQAVAKLRLPNVYALVDGNCLPPLLAGRGCAIVRGDGNVPSIAAASIMAKVTRDRLMCDYARQYPAYSFERHKGYATRAHCQAILTHGVCPIHRRSFLKKLAAAHPELIL